MLHVVLAWYAVLCQMHSDFVGGAGLEVHEKATRYNTMQCGASRGIFDLTAHPSTSTHTHTQTHTLTMPPTYYKSQTCLPRTTAPALRLGLHLQHSGRFRHLYLHGPSHNYQQDIGATPETKVSPTPSRDHRVKHSGCSFMCCVAVAIEINSRCDCLCLAGTCR